MSFDKGVKYEASAETNVSRKTAAKIGLFGAMSIIIGSTVGVGIFFKNGNVFTNNNGNAIGILFSWIIAFLIALTVAYSFGEIVTCKTKSVNSGLAGWFERLVGYRSGRLMKIMLPLVYYGAYMIVDAIFFGEAIFNCFNNKAGGSAMATTHMGYVVLVACAGIAIFATLNIFISNVLQKTSNVTTILKFIPLGLVIFTGIIFGCINSDQNLFVHGNIPTLDGKTYDGKFSFTGMLDSLPAILFAFDSFLVVGNIAGEMKNPQKNVPLSIVFSLITSGVLYLLVTIGQIMVGCGSAYAVFDYVFANNAVAAKAFHIIISIFIFISIFGVLNSMTMGGIRSLESAVDEEIIYGSKYIKKWANGKYLLGGAILGGIIELFYVLIFGIPTMVLNTDQIFDGLSNFIVLLFFFIYSMLSLASIFNRYKPKAPEVTKQKGQIVAAGIGSAGCAFMFAYGFIWQFFGAIISDPGKDFTTWGLFHVNPETFKAWQACMWFWITCGVIFMVPVINELLIKFFDKSYNQPLMWQKYKNQNTL